MPEILHINIIEKTKNNKRESIMSNFNYLNQTINFDLINYDKTLFTIRIKNVALLDKETVYLYLYQKIKKIPKIMFKFLNCEKENYLEICSNQIKGWQKYIYENSLRDPSSTGK